MRDPDLFYKRLVNLLETHCASSTDLVGIGYNLILTLPDSKEYPPRLEALIGACHTMQAGIHEESPQIETAVSKVMLTETRMAVYDT